MEWLFYGIGRNDCENEAFTLEVNEYELTMEAMGKTFRFGNLSWIFGAGWDYDNFGKWK